MKVEIKIPQGINVELKNNLLSVKGSKGLVKREFKSNAVNKKIDVDKIILESIDDRKRSVAILGAIQQHIKNMFSGVNKKFNYKLRIIYSHFPITVVLKGKEFQINNFVGEKKSRIIKIPENVEIVIKGKDIIVSSVDKEAAGIIAGLIEKSAVVKNRDRRIYQDGVYIIEKGVQDE